MQTNLLKGRGEHGNILLIGPMNCEKIFMLKLLKTLFGDCLFENPSNDWTEKPTAILL